jgi:hypothetical protein
MKTKRIIICTIGGIIAGILCMIGGYLRGFITEISILSLLPFFFNRIMLGFVIGISNLKFHYLLNGALIGLLISLISSFAIIENNITAFVAFSVAGIIYGVLIEWFATKIFKCPN